jgi:HrpA-like RNA helicase
MNQEDSSQETSLPRLLKSVEQRNVERQQAQLPILASKDEFCRRLEKERVLVVTAETGSGKTTQLPQYAAEYFGGLVVCTQPRVIAATSLASRVANEYDGMSVGRSVGYRVGITSVISGTNRVPGTDIIFMTDGALVQESAEDRQLSHVRVLIIDEAHERSLNTDIVMGIAKLLLKTRPTDFYVVISSATINPSKFLEFFERSDAEPLNVPGRVYDVHLEYLPKAEDSIERHAVSTLKRLYNQHEGTTLVFLPGQGEIEIAMDLFKRDLPGNCVPLPLYAALSLEEQDQVLQFDEGPNGERRMVVFCTNIAETSLTIKNTRVVIDSGLAKEAYVDKQLRSTAIQTIAISKASADQRKGRAGRTAPVTAFVSTPKTH